MVFVNPEAARRFRYFYEFSRLASPASFGVGAETPSGLYARRCLRPFLVL
jgi:hypothetical protein